MSAGGSSFLSSGDGYVGELLELQQGCEGPFELFGGEGLALYALCIAVSYMLSGYYGLYSEQKILYSKLKPEFVNKKAH